MPVRKIDIDVTGGNPRARFVPDTQVALLGDLISWANNDPEQPHWPAPVTGGTLDRTGFLSEEIPPDESSRQSFSPEAEGNIDYQCVNHSDEKGHISVVATVPLAAPAAKGDAPAMTDAAEGLLTSQEMVPKQPKPTPKPTKKAKPKPKPKPTGKRPATRRAKVPRRPKAASRKAKGRRTGGRRGKR